MILAKNRTPAAKMFSCLFVTTADDVNVYTLVDVDDRRSCDLIRRDWLVTDVSDRFASGRRNLMPTSAVRQN